MVFGVLHDGHAAIFLVNDFRKHLAEGGIHIDGDHLGTRGHGILHGLVAKFDDALQHLLLVVVDLGGHLQGIAEVVHRDIVGHLVGQMTVQTAHALDEQQDEGMEDVGEQLHDGTHRTTERERMVGGIDLRKDFAEKQQQKRQQDGLAQEDEPGRIVAHGHHLGEEVAEKHDDGNIHEVVANQNGGHQVLLLLQQLLDESVAVVLVLVKLVQVAGGEGKEGHLGRRDARRSHEQHYRNHKRNDSSHTGSKKMYTVYVHRDRIMKWSNFFT